MTSEVFILHNGSVFKSKNLPDLVGNAMKVLKELDYQCHLHGEIEPTPDRLIAQECYIMGYIEGKVAGREQTLDSLGLLEQFKEAQKEQEIEIHNKKMKRIERSILKKHTKYDLLQYLEVPQ